MLEKKAKTNYPIDELIEKRWSPRAFDKDKKVNRETILSLCEAARWAPSCFNDQPWRFIVFDREHNENDFNKGFDCLGDWNKSWVKNCQVLIAVLANTKFKNGGKPNHWAEYDTGAAAGNLCLQATSSGLMAHQMAGYDKNKLVEDFNIPEEYSSIAMIAIGYQADAEILNEDLKEMELKERERLPFEENFFDGSWGNGLKG